MPFYLIESWLQIYSKKPCQFPKLCEYIFYHKHKELISLSLQIQTFIVSTKSSTSILLHKKSNMTCIFWCVFAHFLKWIKFWFYLVTPNFFFFLKMLLFYRMGSHVWLWHVILRYVCLIHHYAKQRYLKIPLTNPKVPYFAKL